MHRRTQIGYLVGGGLKENFRVRLTVSPQEVQEGAFVVIHSGNWLYYGIVTDIRLGATDPRFADEHSEHRFPPLIARALHGQTLYADLEVLPTLMLEIGPEPGTPEYQAWRQTLTEEPRPLPIKHIPPHHAPVYLAGEGDVFEIFGKPDETHFVVGYTREQRHPVCLHLDRFVQRSSGVFGATGTGKSFLTRLLLAGLIRRNQVSVLVLDMHNEYGLDDIASDTRQTVRGLKSLFPGRVRVVGLGAGATIRGQPPDFNLEIAWSDLQPADILMLSRELNLTDTAATVLDALVKSFSPSEWFSRFMALRYEDDVEITDEQGKTRRVPHPESVEAWASENGVHPKAAQALHSKLQRLHGKPYLVKEPAADSVGQIIQALESGQHVILSFGAHETDLDYLLVSNLLTRKIRQTWENKTNRFRSSGQSAVEPRPLLIVVEEAHKLLNRELASQTAFATIARELRKYYVTLLIVDQRPSQIDDEVLSQLGTRISGWLGDETDIHAVLSGLPGRDALRGMLARLQPKEEVLIMGWGVPIPLPIRSRRYDPAFWEEISGRKRSAATALIELGLE